MAVICGREIKYNNLFMEGGPDRLARFFAYEVMSIFNNHF